MNDEKKSIRCSFCGKHEDEVERIIAGPGAYICNECVQLCMSLLDDEGYGEEHNEFPETVEQLPDPPRWPQVQQAAEEAKKPKKGIMSRMAKMMEDDDDHEISGINALPPRVSRDEAYRPAKKPTPSGKSKR